MTPKPLRAVADGERRPEPLSLMQAVESGDVLEMLLAQRRLIAAGLATAADNTRPQLNNELNKLHALIAAEEQRRGDDEDGVRGGEVADGTFDASAI